MPSLLEHLGDGDHARPAVGEPPQQHLDSVRTEGRRRRTNRHRRNLGLAVLALDMLAVPAAMLRNGDGTGQDLTVAAGDDGTGGDFMPDVVEPTAIDPVVTLPPSDVVPPALTGTSPSTSAAPQTTPTTAPPATSPPPTAPATTATTTKAAPACRNSTDPACGPFRWDPVPAANKPLVASFSKAPPPTAAPGATVSFEVSWSDPDATLTSDRLATDSTRIGTACTLTPRYGPWTPPAAVPGSGTIPYATTFANPGTYTLVVELGTADCTSPYGSETVVETTIKIG